MGKGEKIDEFVVLLFPATLDPLEMFSNYLSL